MNLIFTVTDKHGRFIHNLQQRDFALLDNQKAPAQVFTFTQQTNLPLRVGVMIDASTSIRQRFQFEQSAAIQFLQQVFRPQYRPGLCHGLRRYALRYPELHQRSGQA